MICRDQSCLRMSSGSVVAGPPVFPCSRSLRWEHRNARRQCWVRAGRRPWRPVWLPEIAVLGTGRRGLEHARNGGEGGHRRRAHLTCGSHQFGWPRPGKARRASDAPAARRHSNAPWGVGERRSVRGRVVAVRWVAGPPGTTRASRGPSMADQPPSARLCSRRAAARTASRIV